MSKGAERLAEVPVTRVRAGGVELAYQEVGEGAPVLLVPGYTGSKEDFGPVLAPLAAAGYRVIALDLRGQLDSPGAGAADTYSLDGLAADVLAFIDELDLAPVHLVGHSFGGLVARAAVLARPAAFASLTLLCSGPGAIGGARGRLMTRLRSDLLAGGTARVAALVRAATGGDGFEAARFAGSDATALLGMGDTLLTAPDQVVDLATTLAAAGIPTLVACGASDDAWPVPIQQAMAEQLGARFATIDGAGHSPTIDQPEASAALLDDFLTGLAR